MESVARNMTNLSITLLVLLFAIIVISLSIFIVLILRAARRQMFLCAALMKQMESTQQAERKSMNKSMAFANASHDVRGSLAAITGLIDVCREEVKTNSELASNLTQIHTCATDVLGKYYSFSLLIFLSYCKYIYFFIFSKKLVVNLLNCPDVQIYCIDYFSQFRMF